MSMQSGLARSWDVNIVNAMQSEGIICRYSRESDGYLSRRHKHVGVGILYCTSGRGIFSFGNQILPYSRGTLIYFNSEIPHQVDVKGTYERWDLCLWPEMVTELMGDKTFNDLTKKFDPGLYGVRVFNIPPSDVERRLLTVFEDLHEEMLRRRDDFKLYLQCKLIELFILLDRSTEATSSREVPVSKVGHRLGAILAYIDEHLPQNPSVESIARAFHYSPSHLYRLIRSATGKTPSQYIRERRIDRAKKLLRDSDLTVSDISRAVGSSSVAHFCKVFRADVGCSPQEYRQQQ